MRTEETTVQSADLSHLPEDLQQRIVQEVEPANVQQISCYDVEAGGRYSEAYLVLAGERLGDFVRRDGRWEVTWTDAGMIEEARVIEGLGLNVLRLIGEESVLADYRYTLRYAKSMAQLHRQLEKSVQGSESADEQAGKGPPAGREDKKLRCDKCGRVIPAWAEHCPACLSRRKILARLLDFVGPYKWRAVTGAALALVITAMGLIAPGLRKPMLDRGLGVAKDASPDWDVFLYYVGLLTGLMLLLAVGRGIQGRIMAGLGSRVSRNIRQAVYAHLHKLSLSFFSKKQTGGLVTRVTSDSDRLWDFIAFTIVEVGVSVLTMVGVGVAMFWLNWRLAFLVLLPIPVMIGLTLFFHTRLHAVFGRMWHRWSQMTAVIADALPGVRVIKAFGQENREIDRFRKRNDAVYDEEMTMVGTWTVFGPIMQFLTQLSELLIWVIGGLWVVRDFYSGTAAEAAMSVGTLMAFVGYMGMFNRPIHMIAHMDRMFNRAATSAQRIFEILDTEPTIFSKTGAATAEGIKGGIELRNVSFSYDGIRKVLRDVSLRIEPGQMVGLAGPSGGGKTTMINLICRFYDALEGQILIDGVDVRDYDIEQLRRRIGVVLQEPFLFHGTVAENISYGHPDATVGQIIEAARAANAHDFIVGFPDGYDTMIGERGHSLSGGERQRISIARAILGNPRILILDEATSSVDTETEKLIQEALDRLIADRTTIAIAHRLSTLRKADRLVVLEAGRIVEEGSHEELARKEDGLYGKLIRMQSELQATMAI